MAHTDRQADKRDQNMKLI